VMVRTSVMVGPGGESVGEGGNKLELVSRVSSLVVPEPRPVLSLEVEDSTVAATVKEAVMEVGNTSSEMKVGTVVGIISTGDAVVTRTSVRLEVDSPLADRVASMEDVSRLETPEIEVGSTEVKSAEDGSAGEYATTEGVSDASEDSARDGGLSSRVEAEGSPISENVCEAGEDSIEVVTEANVEAGVDEESVVAELVFTMVGDRPEVVEMAILALGSDPVGEFDSPADPELPIPSLFITPSTRIIQNR